MPNKIKKESKIFYMYCSECGKRARGTEEGKNFHFKCRCGNSWFRNKRGVIKKLEKLQK